MTTQELIDDVKALLSYELDAYPVDDVENLSDSTVVSFLNRALDRLGRELFLFNPKIALTLSAGVSTYQCSNGLNTSKRMVKVRDVVINGLLLKSCSQNGYGPWSMDELEENAPTWRTASNGTPYAWVRLGTAGIQLHPPPDAAISASSSNFVSGYVYPDAISVGSLSSTPNVDPDLHEHISKLAAAILAGPKITDTVQQAKITEWKAEAINLATKIGKANSSAVSSVSSTSKRTDRTLRV